MKQYVIVSIKHSEKNAVCFWRANDAGYTTNPWQAGIYTEEEVNNSPNYYNDGYNSVAICVTNSSLPSSGITFCIDEKKVAKYVKLNLGQIEKMIVS